jgi:YD repeat-containing protein
VNNETVMYDEDGNETDDRSRAVHGEVVERDDEGRIVRRHSAWEADARALAGDPGEAATRPAEQGED